MRVAGSPESAPEKGGRANRVGVCSCTRRARRRGWARSPRLRLPPLSLSVWLVPCFGGREKCEGLDSERFKWRGQGDAEKVVGTMGT